VVAAGQQGQVAVLAAGVTARLVRVGGRTRRAGGLAARPGDSARRGGWCQEAAGSGRGDVLNFDREEMPRGHPCGDRTLTTSVGA
jgi:hypothetical protein